jgi:hypothetical protein
MSSPASTVLSRPNDFRPFIPDTPSGISSGISYGMPTLEIVRGSGFTATDLIQRIFDAIQDLYHSSNMPRDRYIAHRISVLHQAALAEDQQILPSSLRQFADFFLAHPDLGLPKITLAPDGTLRARWIRGPRNFVAIEFTGEPLAKLVSEIPREDNLTAAHFSSEPPKNIVSVAGAIGASFT